MGGAVDGLLPADAGVEIQPASLHHQPLGGMQGRPRTSV
jgi:hypothetical protein